MTKLVRALRDGLSSLRDRAANLRRRLAALRFNPSRRQRLAGVSAGLFIVAVTAGAHGYTAFALFYFALTAIGAWRLYEEADEQ